MNKDNATLSQGKRAYSISQKQTSREGKEHERSRLPDEKLLGGSYFAAAYAGEHVAGGEFVVGAAFAAWGSSAQDILLGLLIGNLMAVLSWGLICSPVATRSRITLYFYLEKLAGVGTTKAYSIVNGIIFAVIAGGMVTISASAIRAMTDIPSQIDWYPTSALFVIIALLIGAVTTLITIRGFAALSKFAKLCAPWLMVVFLICGLASMPILIHQANAGMSIVDIFDTFVWTGKTPDGSPSLTMWQIAAFTWGLNLPLHLGMGDLSTLRYAKKASYGFYSVLATFGGHFMAWVCAGILGATTALLMQVSIQSLDIGGIVMPILGIAGLAAVFIASLTTAVPSLYRSGLAFKSVFVSQTRTKITVIIGIITTIVACFPLIFLQWLNLMAYFNILLAPIGAIITAEHYILPRMGITPFWREQAGKHHNFLAIATWGAGIILAAVIIILQPFHLFFTFIPVWGGCVLLYAALASVFVEKSPHRSAGHDAMYVQAYGADKNTEKQSNKAAKNTDQPTRKITTIMDLLIGSSLLIMLGNALYLWTLDDPASHLVVFQQLSLLLSVIYFGLSALKSRLQKTTSNHILSTESA